MAVMLIGSTVGQAYDFEVDGIYYNIIGEKDPLYFAEVTFCGNEYSSYNEYSGDIVIPQYVKYNGKQYFIRRIGNSAFRGCNKLTSITMNTVSYIGYAAFTGCTALKSVSMNKVESVEEYAFSNCYSLTSIEIPESMTEIGDFMFDGCEELTSVDLPNTITSVGTCSFRWCLKLKKITIPSSVTTIELKSFYHSGLSMIELPDSVKDIGSSAFEGCTLVPLLINNIDAIQQSSLNGLNQSSVILVPTVEDVAKVKPLFEGSVYPNTVYFVDSLKSFLGGVEFTLGNNPYYASPCSLTNIIVNNKSITPNENGLYYVDNLIPDSTYEVGICLEYEAYELEKNEQINIGIKKSSATKIIRDTIHTEFSTLEPDWQLNHVLNSTYSTCEIQIHWNSDKTVSPSEWGAYVLERDVSISVSEEEFKEKQIKLKGKKIKANLDGVINATGLQPDKEYYFWPYAIYNGKEYLEIWDYIPVKTQLPQLGITDLNITQTTYEAQITASEDEYSSPSEKGIYLKVNSLDEEEWVKYKADSAGKVKVTGLLPYTSYYVRPYATYNWKEITQLENYDIYYKSIKTKPIEPFAKQQAPYSVNHIDLSVSSGTLDSDLSVVELGVEDYYFSKEPVDDNRRITMDNLTPGQSVIVRPYVKVRYKSTDQIITAYGDWTTFTTEVPELRGTPQYSVSPTSIDITQWTTYTLYDGTYKGFGYTSPSAATGNACLFTGLQPNTTYTVSGYVMIEEGNYKAETSVKITTPALILTTLPAKATSNTKAVICAETNIANEETGTGFEFRRIDAPDLVPSTVVYCAVHDEVMEGILNNLSSNTYYKYRPFYKSASGKMYYGEWIGFGTADAYVYFTPTVHTYATAGVENNSVTLNGYALPGSDDILEQGFEYWTDGITRAAANGVQTVTATGQRMTITLNDLQYNTTYRYRAYVKTAKETTYGEEMTFTTGAAPSGIGEVATEELDVEVRTLSGGSLELRLSGAETTTARYALYTPNGVSVVVGELTSVGEWQPIGDSSLSQGFYLLRVENNKLCRTVKVMVK